MLNVIQPASDSTVTLIGTGVVGSAALVSLRMSKTTPQKVVFAGIVAQCLETAKSLGASDLYQFSRNSGFGKVLTDITNGEGLDGTIDTTGRPEIVEALLSSTGKKENVVTVGVGDVSGEGDGEGRT